VHRTAGVASNCLIGATAPPRCRSAPSVAAAGFSHIRPIGIAPKSSSAGSSTKMLAKKDGAGILIFWRDCVVEACPVRQRNRSTREASGRAFGVPEPDTKIRVCDGAHALLARHRPEYKFSERATRGERDNRSLSSANRSDARNERRAAQGRHGAQ